jgi:hypothetical protein
VFETKSKSRERGFHRIFISCLGNLPSRDPQGRAALLTQEGAAPLSRFRGLEHLDHNESPVVVEGNSSDEVFDVRVHGIHDLFGALFSV